MFVELDKHLTSTLTMKLKPFESELIYLIFPVIVNITTLTTITIVLNHVFLHSIKLQFMVKYAVIAAQNFIWWDLSFSSFFGVLLISVNKSIRFKCCGNRKFLMYNCIIRPGLICFVFYVREEITRCSLDMKWGIKERARGKIWYWNFELWNCWSLALLTYNTISNI